MNIFRKIALLLGFVMLTGSLTWAKELPLGVEALNQNQPDEEWNEVFEQQSHKTVQVKNENESARQALFRTTAQAQLEELPTAVFADVNKDGVVDILDLTLVGNNFGKSGTGDIDKNGVVDIFDLTRIGRE